MEIVGPAETKSNWRQLETKYKEMFPARKVLYSRYDKGCGHVAVSSFKQDLAEVEKEVKIKLDLEEFTIRKPDKPTLEKFWAEHGTHFNLCTNKKLSLSSIDNSLLICS